MDRIIDRFGHHAPIRETMLARDDLSMAMRQALLSKLSQTLAGFVTARQWMGPEHAEYAAQEACEKATVALAADTAYEEVGALVQHLRQSGQLTAGMLLRALLSGNVVLFEEALAELSDMDRSRDRLYPLTGIFRPARSIEKLACLMQPVQHFVERSPPFAPACSSASGAGSDYETPGGRTGPQPCADERGADSVHCCGNCDQAAREGKLGCSATTWSPTHASCTPTISSRRSSLPLEMYQGTIDGLFSCLAHVLGRSLVFLNRNRRRPPVL
jgi:hypothetical protein